MRARPLLWMSALALALAAGCTPSPGDLDAGMSSSSSSGGGGSSSTAGASSSSSPGSSSRSPASSASSATSTSSSGASSSSSSSSSGSSSLQSSSGTQGSSDGASSSAAQASSSLGGGSSSAGAPSSSATVVDAGVDCAAAPVHLSALHACFGATGNSCVDDGRATSSDREIRFTSGALIAANGGGDLRQASYWNDAGQLCFTERYEGTTLIVEAANGCAAATDDGGAVSALIDAIACVTVVPRAGQCQREDPSLCDSHSPECCDSGDGSDEILDCTPSGLCQAIGGTVVGVYGAPDGGSSSSGGMVVDTSYKGGTSEVCAAAIRLTPDSSAHFDTSTGTPDAGAGNQFNTSANMGCGGSPAPDMVFLLAVTMGEAVSVTLQPDVGGPDLTLTALNECPVPEETTDGENACGAISEMGGPGEPETLVLRPGFTGDIYLVVDGFTAGDFGGFALSSTTTLEQCGEVIAGDCGSRFGVTREVEPNGGWFAATLIGGGIDVFAGQIISADGDEDWYAFDLTETTTLDIQVVGAGNTPCPGTLTMQLLDAARAEVAVSYGNVSNCPRLNGFGADTALADMAPGRYYLALDPSYSNTSAPKDYWVRLHRYRGGSDAVCSTAPRVTPGTVDGGPNSAHFDTTLSPDGGRIAFSLPPLAGCVGSLAPDVVVAVAVTGGVPVVVRAVPDEPDGGPDLSLSVIEICPLPMVDADGGAGTCLASSNARGPGGSEALSLYSDTAREFFVVVDGVQDTAMGGFNLEVQEAVVECGDGVRVGAEQCDDGERLPGDGCDENCNLEYTAEVEAAGQSVNDTLETAVRHVAGPLLFRGSITGNGDRDFFRFNVPTSGTVTLQGTGEDAMSNACPGDIDFYLYEGSATDNQDFLEYDDYDGDGNRCPKIVRTLTAGDYIVRVQHYSYSGTAYDYYVRITLP